MLLLLSPIFPWVIWTLDRVLPRVLESLHCVHTFFLQSIHRFSSCLSPICIEISLKSPCLNHQYKQLNSRKSRAYTWFYQEIYLHPQLWTQLLGPVSTIPSVILVSLNSRSFPSVLWLTSLLEVLCQPYSYSTKCPKIVYWLVIGLVNFLKESENS